MRIALCGSTRFESLFHELNVKLALAGHTVYSLSTFGREASDTGKDDKMLLSEAEKVTFDLVHLDKILNSDAIVVVNEDYYVSLSTSREIQWARMQDKSIYWYMSSSIDEISVDELLDTMSPARTAPSPVEPVVSPVPMVPRHTELDDDIPF